MPDDSSREYAASQQSHAAKIKAERTLMDAFGASREQVRAFMQGKVSGGNNAIPRKRGHVLVDNQPVVKKPAEIVVEEQKFEVKRDAGAQRKATPAQAPAQGLVVVGLDVNGVPGTYRSVGEDFRRL